MAKTARILAAAALGSACMLAVSLAQAWWDDDDYYDRWGGGPWHGGYPGYGYGWGHPGYGGWGYPGYGGWGYPGYGGWGYPGYGWGHGWDRPQQIHVYTAPEEPSSRDRIE